MPQLVIAFPDHSLFCATDVYCKGQQRKPLFESLVSLQINRERRYVAAVLFSIMQHLTVRSVIVERI